MTKNVTKILQGINLNWSKKVLQVFKNNSIQSNNRVCVVMTMTNKNNNILNMYVVMYCFSTISKSFSFLNPKKYESFIPLCLQFWPQNRKRLLLDTTKTKKKNKRPYKKSSISHIFTDKTLFLIRRRSFNFYQTFRFSFTFF